MVASSPAPGPIALPVLGNLANVGMAKISPSFGSPPHQRMAELAAEHGDVMTVRMGQEPWIVLSTPEVVHEAFVTKGSSFAGRPMVASMGISAGEGRAGFGRSQPDKSLSVLRRTAFGELFSAAQVASAQAELEDEARRLAEHLLANDSRSSLRRSLRRCVENMVLRYAFSVRVPYATEAALPTESRHAELLTLTDAIWTELTETSTFAMDLLGVSADASVRESLSPLRDLVDDRNRLLLELVAARKAAHGARGASSAASPDMLDVLLNAGLPEEDVLYTLVDMFVAGVNTVASTLEWTLLLGAAYPLEQARARAGAKKANGRQPSPRVQALTKEVLRFKPPLLLPRMATRDASIGGFDVPKGHVVYANHWSLTRSPAHWLEAAAFRPERWLREESGFDATRGSASGCKFLPYGVGQRACPGTRLAEAELQEVTHTLLRHVRWSKTAPIDLAEDYGLTLSPAVEQRLKFEAV